MIEEKEHRALKEEINKLKKELDSLKNTHNYTQENKFKTYLYSPSTNDSREAPNSSHFPMSAHYKPNNNLDEF